MHNSTPQPLECSLSDEKLSAWLKLETELYSQLGMYEIHHALDSVDRELFLSLVRQQKWGAALDLLREAVLEDVTKRAWKALAKLEEAEA